MLEDAVNKTRDVEGHFCKGLQALENNDKGKFKDASARITGSLNIDTATRQLYPNANRWDYAVEHDSTVHFVEVHPAKTGEVNTILAKHAWLVNWLEQSAPAIDSLKAAKPYHWVASGRVSIPNRNASQYRRLIKLGLKPTEQWNPNR